MARIKEVLQRVFSPEKFGREQANIFVTKYNTIKQQLQQLGAKLLDFEYRDEDGKWVTTFTLSCSKDNTDAVRALLDRAAIKELSEPNELWDRMKTAGAVTSLSSGPIEHDLKFLENELNTRQFTIYSGKHMSLEDSKRLHAPISQST